MGDDRSQRVRLHKGMLDLESGEIEGASVRLSPTERALVRWLVDHGGPADLEQLLQEVWGYREGVRSRTVYSTIDRARKKLEVDPKRPDHLVTVEGGYAWVPCAAVVLPDDVVGRAALAAQLESRLREGGAVALVGPGGVGKTRLAKVAVDQLADRFAERLWVELRGVTQLHEARDRLGRALQLRDASPDTLAAALGGRSPVLLVLDDLDALEPGAAQLVEALAPSRDVTVLVTCRRRVVGTTPIDVGPLAPWASRALLTRLAPSAADDPELEALAARLDHLPLALHLAAAWLGPLSPVDVAEVGGSLGLDDCIARSWDLLGLDDRRWLSRLARLGGRVPLSLGVALGEGAGLPGLAHLEARSLITIGDGAVELLETVRAFAEARADGALTDDRPALDWVAGTCGRATAALCGPQHAEALAPVREALPVVLRVLAVAERHPRWQQAVLDLTEALLRLGPVPQLDGWLTWIAAHAADPRLKSACAVVRSRLAVRRGLEAAEVLADEPPRAWGSLWTAWRVQRGRLALDSGRPADAIDDFEAALQGADGIDRRRAWYGLARVHRAQQQAERAEHALDQLEGLSRVAGDPVHEMAALTVRAHLERARGALVQAEVYGRRAHDLALAIGEPVNAAHIARMLGGLAGMQGRFREGTRHFEAAAATYRRHGLLESEGFVRLGQATHVLWGGEPGRAEPHLLSAETAFRRSGFRRGRSAVEGVRGRVLVAQGRHGEAADAFERALELLGDEAPARLSATLVGLQALCWLVRGEAGWAVRAQSLPQTGVAGVLRELAGRVAAGEAGADEVRALVASSRLDAMGMGT